MLFKPGYFKAFLILLIIEICIATFITTGFIRHTAGDFLVVIMLYCLLKSFINIKPLFAAWITLLISTGIEVGQFFDLLDELGLRENRLANIILGNAFSYGDLLAYLMGIIAVMIVEHRRENRLA